MTLASYLSPKLLISSGCKASIHKVMLKESQISNLNRNSARKTSFSQSQKTQVFHWKYIQLLFQNERKVSEI